MEIIRASELWEKAGAYYVRIQAMARKHNIPLRQEFDEHDGPGTRYVVALDEGFPAATARMYETGADSVMIGRVVVLPEYRHRGIGTMVIRECEAWALEEGYRKSVVESRDNKTEFYLKMGYRFCGSKPILGETFRCIRMEKALRRTLVFYGDSNTWGYDPADMEDGRYPEEACWTSITAKNLGERFEVIPEGQNGRRLPVVTRGHAYLDGLVAKVKDGGILCTMLGTNDVLGLSLPDASGPVRRMQEYLAYLTRELSPEQILIIAPVPSGSPDLPDPYLQAAYAESRKMNDAFRRLSGEAGVLFADAADWNVSLAYDHIHFSAEGHRTFAGEMSRLIKELTQ